MGSVSVAVLLACGKLLAALGLRPEQGIVPEFVPEAAAKRLDEGVLRRLFGRDVMPVDPRLLAPLEHCHAGQFGAVVADNRSGSSAPRLDRRQLLRDTQPGHRGIGDQSQALEAEVINDGQHAEPTSVSEGVG